MSDTDNKPTVLFVTQTLGVKQACGIGIMGDMVGQTLLACKDYNFKLLYTDTYDDVDAAIAQYQPVAVIYNYSIGTAPWMDQQHVRNKYSSIPHFKIHHDMHQQLVDSFQPQNYGGFKYVIADDPTLIGKGGVFITQRLMPPYKGPFYPDPEIPTIGFQGFGPWHKGIARMATMVNNEFDEAIIRLHIPGGYMGDPHTHDAQRRVKEAEAVITKPGIKIVATHDFLTRDEMMDIIARNTINCYLYDFNAGGGLASSPDFGLAVGKPIAVTKSHQLRNFWSLSPSVCVEDRTLKQIIASGITPLKHMHENYTAENVIRDYTIILNSVLLGHA